MKKTIFYIVRHGETDWNALGKVQGQADIPLNGRGMKQAKDLAKLLESIEIHHIYSSDLSRARKTAEIVGKSKKLSVRTLKDLRERNQGIYEGMMWINLREQFPEFYAKVDNLAEEERFKTTIHESVESDEDLLNRLTPLLKQLDKKHAGKSILIANHGGLMRALLMKLGHGTHKDKFDIENCSYIQLVVINGEFMVEKMEGIEIKEGKDE